MDISRKAVAAIAAVLAFAADDHASGRSLRGHGTPIGSVCSKNCGRTQTATAQQPGADGTPDAQEARPAQRCSVSGLVPQPPARRPHYALDVRVHPDLKTVEGALTVTFSAPRSGGTDRLVFRLWPNGPRYASAGAHLAVSHVQEGARTLPVSQPNPTTLVVSRRLGPGERVVVSMDWRLVLPGETGLRLKGGGRSIRLGSFFPVLAWDGNDLALDPPTTLANAEAWTTPTADFDVRLTHLPSLRALASGQPVRKDSWRARAVRDFTLALGHFTVVTGTAHAPAPVHVTVGVEATPLATAGRVLLRRAIASLERYSSLYGSYPWPSYTVAAMADLSGLEGGLEYPTLVYQPTLGENVPHETAHQWFYSLVGNNQARDPWLDEGLATWAEAGVNGAPPFPTAIIPPEVANRIGEPDELLGPLRATAILPRRLPAELPSAAQPRLARPGRLRAPPLRPRQRLPHRTANRPARSAPSLLPRGQTEA